MDWEDSEFNLCHFAIALFYAEEVVKLSFTTNWDPKLEDAICRVAGRQQPRIARNRQTMGEVGTDPCLVHMHGHCLDPDSLVMTSKELKGPDALKWTDPSLRAALTKQDPIFVGFAAEPEYVIESLREMRAEMQRPPASVIGIESTAKFSSDSAALAEALKLGEDEDRYVQGEACEVMGELLRCCYRKRIDQVLADAEARAGVGAGTRRVLSASGTATVRSAIEALSTEKLLALLWSATAKVDKDGAARQASIAKISSQLAETLAVLMVLASCDDAEEITVSRGGFRLGRADGTTVDLWPAIPEDYLSPDRRPSPHLSAQRPLQRPRRCQRAVGAHLRGNHWCPSEQLKGQPRRRSGSRRRWCRSKGPCRSHRPQRARPPFLRHRKTKDARGRIGPLSDSIYLLRDSLATANYRVGAVEEDRSFLAESSQRVVWVVLFETAQELLGSWQETEVQAIGRTESLAPEKAWELLSALGDRGRAARRGRGRGSTRSAVIPPMRARSWRLALPPSPSRRSVVIWPLCER